ncbi:serine/threonine-protein kinase Nek10-like [Biomphalaria glabrata]|uniref:Serine/threonine-protein kinase Nek10-like n=1 Tax=Biomphalaria glabrata TaxID=6526 RepID=A0A9W3BQE2_BIOGL|nr:serine/threonine-protein kinase Nek10-like [Biomphalaria glabrata]XP_055901769.1 serine/threonine-protein kinase Nek10-like [Biomphalaria glabrata]
MTMPVGDKLHKQLSTDKELGQLEHLKNLINTQVSKQIPEAKYTKKKSSNQASGDYVVQNPKENQNKSFEAEEIELDNFSIRYKDERQFSSHQYHNYFLEICVALTEHRLSCQEWLSQAPSQNILRVLISLRILLRDSNYQKQFCKIDGVKSLTEYFKKSTEMYLFSTGGLLLVDHLKEMTNIFQKLLTSVERCELLVECEAHIPLVQLLTATDPFVLHGSLYALIGFAQSENLRLKIGELNSVEILLRIIKEYDITSKKLAANLLRLLCSDHQTKEKVKMEDGVSLLLSQLHSNNASFLWHIVWCLVLLCEDAGCRDDIRQLGGIPLLLSILHEKKFSNEQSHLRRNVASAGTIRKTISHDENDESSEQISLKKACCAALSELMLNDTNAQHIVQANGVYSLGLLILPQDVSSEKEKKRSVKLQQNAFRALRFLFSMERNRRLFKQLFTPELFEMFIDVGHYNRDLQAYKSLAEKMNSLPKSVVNEIAENISNTNHNKEPSYYIGDYAVFELLGTGAFGSVYKVRKKTGRQSFFALKEVNLQSLAFGKSANEKAMSVGEITNELKIMKEEMRHPNIVRYFKTFELNDKLYIVMEYIEGAHLGEHFNSLKEKNERFQENRIRHILLQLILALRYLHKEKGIVHRDLTPSNIMLGENDKVTITDFGLAKQKRNDCSKMTSVVGTILYSCPEVVQNLAYGEKADIWALGCILYQMCVLEPPFNNTNMLVLVKKIVAAEFKPIPDKDYSSQLLQTIKSCLSVNPDERPDILELSSQLTDLLLSYMDNLRISENALQRKLERERKRTQKYVLEVNRAMQNNRPISSDFQDLDRSASLSGSFGVESPKDQPVDQLVDVSDASLDSSVALSISSIHFGDRSDEDSYASSGSESRESSAGSVRSHQGAVNFPKMPHLHKVRPLKLDIPNTAKASRDSGLGSGDPSPNTCLHHSASELAKMSLASQLFLRSHSTLEGNVAPKLDKRSRSVATLSISPNKLREINDPIQPILQQLHKLILVTQLPPTIGSNPNRRIIEHYKRALFSPKSNSSNLKSEMLKLIQGSRELIDLNFGHMEYIKRSSLLASDLDSPLDPNKPVTLLYDPDFKDVGITYEYLQNILEETLKEMEFYAEEDVTKHRTS